MSADAKYPRDRWIGVSPELNVTPGGKALEALDCIKALASFGDVSLKDIERIIKEVKVYQG